MQLIFQDPFSSLNPRMTVSQSIALPLIIQGIIKKNDKNALNKKIEEMMDLVGLASRFVNSYPHELDGGRRQRIGIARALSLNPQFIVCDEPVSALDVSIQAQILNLMQDLQKEMGLTYLFITHDLSVVKHLANKKSWSCIWERWWSTAMYSSYLKSPFIHIPKLCCQPSQCLIQMYRWNELS